MRKIFVTLALAALAAGAHAQKSPQQTLNDMQVELSGRIIDLIRKSEDLNSERYDLLLRRIERLEAERGVSATVPKADPCIGVTGDALRHCRAGVVPARKGTL